MPLKGIYQAVEGLRTALKGINGATGGYHFNLENRVYRQLHVPEAGGEHLTMPYLCLPKVDDSPQYENHDRQVEIHFRQPVYGYVADPDSTGIDSLGPERCDKLHDDILKAVRLNPTLGGQAKNCEVIAGGGTSAGIFPDETYGEVVVHVEIYIIVDTTDLGV